MAAPDRLGAAPAAEADYVRATRTSYDAMAERYTEHVRGELDRFPLARAMLGLFAELVTDAGGGAVLDAGCGPGRVAGHLGRLGLEVRGIDLSPTMVEIARREHPAHDFAVGSLLDLDVPDESLAGVLAWYSLIHVPPADQPRVLAELHRVLRPGGHLLMAFQIGTEPVHRDELDGIPLDLVFHRLDLDRMAAMAEEAGFDILSRTRAERRPEERTPQGFVLARRP